MDPLSELIGRPPESLAEEIINLRRALESRTVIAQATGIVMARLDRTAAEAFERLVRFSQHRNQKLGELAAEMIVWHEDKVASKRSGAALE